MAMGFKEYARKFDDICKHISEKVHHVCAHSFDILSNDWSIVTFTVVLPSSYMQITVPADLDTELIEFAILGKYNEVEKEELS